MSRRMLSAQVRRAAEMMRICMVYMQCTSMVSEMVRLCAKPHPPFHPEGFSGGKDRPYYGLVARAGDGQRSS